MTADRFRVLVEGAVALWQARVRMSFDLDSYRCVIESDGTTVTISYQETGLGNLWRIETPGRTARVHRSMVPALTTLRDLICPDRPRGRALFVPTPAEMP